ncbi:hypothetical protein IJE86_07855 [bacterium]|nr:hypothetical protein [bacterium]
MQITVQNEFIKIGQWFKGNINGAKFKIIDITKGLKQEPYKVQQSPKNDTQGGQICQY